MIASFGDRATEELFHGISSRYSRKLPNQIHEMALYKLDLLNAAQALEDLLSPPGNRLESLHGDLRVFTAFASTPNGASSFDGRATVPMMYKLLITTDGGKP